MDMKTFGRSNLPQKCPERKGHFLLLMMVLNKHNVRFRVLIDETQEASGGTLHGPALCYNLLLSQSIFCFCSSELSH